MKQPIKFAVMADLHLDIMHDGQERVDAFLAEAEKENVDFIISLGDFLYAEKPSYSLCPMDKLPANLLLAMEYPTKIPTLDILSTFNSFPKPVYHVLGNHDLDFSSKSYAINTYKIPNPYYSFHMKGWHFIVLDLNFFQDEAGNIIDYNMGNYFVTTNLPYIPDEQLQWLEKEIASSTEPIILFSHQSLLNRPLGLRNFEPLQEIIKKANATSPKVLLAINGHLHIDDLHERDHVFYYTINSISNNWLGPEYAAKRYSDEIEKAFPSLKYVIPYETPLYTVISLDEAGFHSKGKAGSFMPPTPEELGFKGPVSSSIQERNISWPK